MEVSPPARRRFSKIDTNRSGTLDVIELQRALALGGLNFSLKTVQVTRAELQLADVCVGRQGATRAELHLADLCFVGPACRGPACCAVGDPAAAAEVKYTGSGPGQLTAPHFSA